MRERRIVSRNLCAGAVSIDTRVGLPEDATCWAGFVLTGEAA